LVIGTVNVVVSFMLALHVALEANARGSRTADGRLIVRAALARWSRGRSADVLRARNTIEPVSATRITAA
jgi:site-specific recombinase